MSFAPHILRVIGLQGFSRRSNSPESKVTDCPVFMRLSQSSMRSAMSPPIALQAAFSRTTAQILWHQPVDELHSTENKGHKFSNVFLTLLLVALCSLSFFDSIPKFSRLVVSPGLKRAHLDHRRTWKSSANPATAVAGDQGRRSRDARVKAFASPARHGGAGRESSLAPAKATGPEERNSSGARESQDKRAAHRMRIRCIGQSGRTDEPDGLPAANWQTC